MAHASMIAPVTGSEIRPATTAHTSVSRALLLCGILSSLLYVGMNAFIPLLSDHYSIAGQTVSELSAIGAPTRPVWFAFGLAYSALLLAFGWGVRAWGERNRRVRIAGGFIIASAFIGIFWPPMHTREVLAAGGGTLTDTLHIAWTAVCVPLVMVAIGVAAGAFGKSFRLYSIATIVVMLGFGALTGIDSPRMEANLPTPWIGVWERIGIGAQMLWVAVFAARLRRDRGREAP